MISHEYKCIFIHIPRCGGTSVETLMAGGDWWDLSPETKHLTARQAKSLYSEHWDDYFKFSIVRNPFARMISCLKYADHFGIELDGNDIDLFGYHQKFGQHIILEHDHRFYRREDLLSPSHLPNQVYGNILDADLDHIGQLEAIDETLLILTKELGLDVSRLETTEKSNPPISTDALSDETKSSIAQLYARDLERFGYEI
ncbi:sulfotransferase family 2 domain-containing protein [Amorphus orientalis]|uniref:Sulfotransferase family protein n=1 Tax=Amorphus orientalis TaxID=649198 RepID=A0AAE3VQX0_9HYPH|nr:sulfotransferase family 2 domain-containing protein [Amorphus orientalis]MDQ0316195.1 hypothetical protein [Amorphus orientalis]